MTRACDTSGTLARVLAPHTPICVRVLCIYMRVPCPCLRVCKPVCPETHAAAPGAHAPVPLHALEHATGCIRRSALRLRAFRWRVCACVQILSGLLTGCSSTKHFACARLALAFCVHWSIFIAGVTCLSGQTNATASLRREVVSFCMHARAHTGIGAHFCTHTCLLAILPAAATCCRRLPHLLPLIVLRKPGPHTHLCLPLCAALCNRRSARVPQPLPSQPAATGLSTAALPPPALSAAAARFAQTKTPRCSETSWRTRD